MSKLLDAFWRAVLYCIHPRIILFSLVPVFVIGGVSLLLGSVYLADALNAVRTSLESHEIFKTLISWLGGSGEKAQNVPLAEPLGAAQVCDQGGGKEKAQSMYSLLAAVLLQCLTVPAVVTVTLLFVTLFMTPDMVNLVGTRRFPQLEHKQGEGWRPRLMWMLDSTMAAVVVLMMSVPLWLVPPLILILPSVIWGWLTYRLMSHGALAAHATPEEFTQLCKEHQLPLLAIGMLSGYLGTVPGVLWVSAAIFEGAMWLLAVVAIWTYTLVFAFSSLWFVHYGLAALEVQRQPKA